MYYNLAICKCTELSIEGAKETDIYLPIAPASFNIQLYSHFSGAKQLAIKIVFISVNSDHS